MKTWNHRFEAKLKIFPPSCHLQGTEPEEEDVSGIKVEILPSGCIENNKNTVRIRWEPKDLRVQNEKKGHHSRALEASGAGEGKALQVVMGVEEQMLGEQAGEIPKEMLGMMGAVDLQIWKSCHED